MGLPVRGQRTRSQVSDTRMWKGDETEVEMGRLLIKIDCDGTETESGRESQLIEILYSKLEAFGGGKICMNMMGSDFRISPIPAFIIR